MITHNMTIASSCLWDALNENPHKLDAHQLRLAVIAARSRTAMLMQGKRDPEVSAFFKAAQIRIFEFNFAWDEALENLLAEIQAK